MRKKATVSSSKSHLIEHQSFFFQLCAMLESVKMPLAMCIICNKKKYLKKLSETIMQFMAIYLRESG